MPRKRNTMGTSHVGLQVATIEKIRDIADRWKEKDQMNWTYSNVVAKLVNDTHDKINDRG